MAPFRSDARDRLAGVVIAYTDLDGTMLGANGSFLHDATSEPTLEPARALLAARAAGIEVVPVSGRALEGLLKDARMLGLPTVIADMGARIGYDFGATVVENRGETPAAGPPVPLMEPAIVLLLEHFAGRVELHAPWAAGREYTQLLRGALDPAEAEAFLGTRGYGWIAVQDNGRLHRDHLGLGEGRSYVYHLLARGVSKARAVEIDRARRRIAREQTIALGDALADLELAAHVGTFIVPGDAVDSDPALAEAVTNFDNVLITERAQNLGWADALTFAATARRP